VISTAEETVLLRGVHLVTESLKLSRRMLSLIPVCMYVYVHVCMHVCMYVCMYYYYYYYYYIWLLIQYINEQELNFYKN